MAQVPKSPTPGDVISLLMTHIPPVLSDLLSNALAKVPDIRAAETVGESAALSHGSGSGNVDVILLGSSWHDKSRDTVAILESLLVTHKNAKAIVLSQRPDYQETLALFRAGARGLLAACDLSFDLFCKSIRCVHQGEVWANNEVTSYLVASLLTPRSSVVTDSKGRRLLTDREQQVLHLLADGLSNGELAAELGLSGHTVKNHLFRIYDKLGVSNRMEAMLYALNPRLAQAAPEIPHPMRGTEAAPIRIVRAC